ncbi:unnamed protein product [Clonostachys solani]|uniref:Uncharacterized protein n=1 Tax=Clonostachys solani TaxID=160281 RepID=A0A9P0ERH8_9HYPO|nr:unnamed protein product [Clonostachys solani]
MNISLLSLYSLAIKTQPSPLNPIISQDILYWTLKHSSINMLFTKTFALALLGLVASAVATPTVEERSGPVCTDQPDPTTYCTGLGYQYCYGHYGCI